MLNKIPKSLWSAIIGFHRHVAMSQHSECVTYHKWSKKTQKYITIIPWQTCKPNPLSTVVGIHDLDLSREREANFDRSYGEWPVQDLFDAPHNVELSWSDPKNSTMLSAYRRFFGEEFLPACTVYSRANCEGGLSYIKSLGEDIKSDWHLTLGNLFSKQHDVKAWTSVPFINSSRRFVVPNMELSPLEVHELISSDIDESFIYKDSGTWWWQPHSRRVNSKFQRNNGPLAIPFSPYPTEASNADTFSCFSETLDSPVVEMGQKITQSVEETWEKCDNVDQLFALLESHAPLIKEQAVRIAVNFAELFARSQQDPDLRHCVDALPEVAPPLGPMREEPRRPPTANKRPLQMAMDWLANPTGADCKASSIAWERARQVEEEAKRYSKDAWSIYAASRSARAAREAAKDAAAASDVELLLRAKDAAKEAMASLEDINCLHFRENGLRWRSTWSTSYSIWEIAIAVAESDEARIAASSVAFAALSSELYEASEAASRASVSAFERASDAYTSSSAFWAQASAAAWAADRDAACAAKSAVDAAGAVYHLSKWARLSRMAPGYSTVSLGVCIEMEEVVKGEWDEEACEMLRDIVTNPFA